MSCAGIIHETPHHPHPLFSLPCDHAALLTPFTRLSNMALLAQYVPVLGRLERRVATAFRSGDALRPAEYAHFDAVAGLDVLQTVGDDLVTRLGTRAPGLLHALRDGASVLCAGAAGARVFIKLARDYPASWFTVYVGSAHQLEAGRALLGEQRGAVGNVHFREMRALDALREKRSYDAGLILDGSGVRGAREPREALAAVYAALRGGAPLAYMETAAEGCPVKDVGHPAGAFVYALSAMHALPSAGSLGGEAVGEAVGGVWGNAKAEQVMRQVGFLEVEGVVEDGLNCLLVGWTAEDAE